MNEIKISAVHKDLNYDIVAGSETIQKSLHQSRLIIELVKELISVTDTAVWEKVEHEASPDEFYAAVLDAIASHYAHTYLQHLEETVPAHEIIKDLVDDLHTRGHLHEAYPDFQDEE